MKQLILVLFAAVIAVSANAQEKNKLFKDFLYEDIFKYGTIYVAGDIQNSKENAKDYFVRTNPSGNMYTTTCCS